MIALWTRNTEISFHKTVFELAKTRQNPLPPINYRGQLHDDSTGLWNDHVLSFEDELQLADHIAFLAQVSEGFAPITAVCIEEQRNGLKMVLAQNQLRDSHVLNGLRQVVQVIERCCQEGMGSRKLREQLFSEVLNLSERRIMERLSPPWYPAPPHWTAHQKRKRALLSRRIKNFVLPKLISPAYADVRSKLEDICDILNPLETRKEGLVLRECITAAVSVCASAFKYEGKSSLESQLREVLDSLTEAGRKSIVQIDKIARYFHLCNDIAKLSKKSAYRPFFCNISLEHLISPEATKPLGAGDSCSVHAEVQLILHYEHISVNPAPRVIGCSKSACFLCDRFIQEHGKYHLSSAHRRIYPKWTVPNIDWMTMEQITVFRSILHKMTKDMRHLINQYNTDTTNVLPAPLESKACLPLSQISTSTDNTAPLVVVEASSEPLSINPESLNPSLKEAEQDSIAKFQDMITTAIESSACSSQTMRVSRILPTYYKLGACHLNTSITIGLLTVVFDFDCSSVWDISIRAVGNTSTESVCDAELYSVENLSTREAISLIPQYTDTFMFRLQLDGLQSLEIQLRREDSD